MEAEIRETNTTAVVTDGTDGGKHIAFGVPAGEPGTGMEIKGIYDTATALGAAVANPAQGDMYAVGTGEPYTIYMWDATGGTGGWVSLGEIRGAKGDAGAQGPKGDTGAQGPKGDDGVSPTVAVEKTGGVATVTITDAAGAHTFTVSDGAKGDTGDTGATGATGRDLHAIRGRGRQSVVEQQRRAGQSGDGKHQGARGGNADHTGQRLADADAARRRGRGPIRASRSRRNTAKSAIGYIFGGM